MWALPECLGIGGGLLALYWVCLHNGPFPSYDASVYFTCTFVALLVFLPIYAFRDRIPYSKAADDLGEISYPLYLVHTIVGWAMLHAITRATGQFYVALVVTIPVVFLLAVLVHRYVEKPSMEFGRRLAAKPRFRRDDAELPRAPADA